MMKSRIREVIEQSGFTRKYIAKKMGVTEKQLSNWVVGRSKPTIEKAFKLAKLLGVKVDDLYDYEE